MKKFKMLAACLGLTLSLSALTACGTNRNNTNTNNSGNNPAAGTENRVNENTNNGINNTENGMNDTNVNGTNGTVNDTDTNGTNTNNTNANGADTDGGAVVDDVVEPLHPTNEPASAETRTSDNTFLNFMFFLLFVRCPLREGIKLYSVKSSSLHEWIYHQDRDNCNHGNRIFNRFRI